MLNVITTVSLDHWPHPIMYLATLVNLIGNNFYYIIK